MSARLITAPSTTQRAIIHSMHNYIGYSSDYSSQKISSRK